jgi:hypothetical protein
MASKYGNKKTWVDNILFDSAREAARYRELRMCFGAGVIGDLELQPEYELQPAFEYQGKRIRAIVYRGDFRYVENGRVVVEDVKGFKTKDFLLKAKMFQYRYADVELRLV